MGGKYWTMWNILHPKSNSKAKKWRKNWRMMSRRRPMIATTKQLVGEESLNELQDGQRKNELRSPIKRKQERHKEKRHWFPWIIRSLIATNAIRSPKFRVYNLVCKLHAPIKAVTQYQPVSSKGYKTFNIYYSNWWCSLCISSWDIHKWHSEFEWRCLSIE